MSTTLKMDYDFKKGFKKFLERMSTAYFLLELNPLSCKVFSTKHGYHVYVTVVEDLNNLELVCVQAILGSDFKRECFNFNRVKFNPLGFKSDWNVLFNKKWNHLGELISKEVFDKSLTNWYWNHVLSKLYCKG